MLKVLISDIDGVLTDGTVWLDACGGEQKRISFRDLDALWELQRAGYAIAFVTGEKGEWTDMIRGRLPHRHFYSGCKDKKRAVLEILQLEGASPAETCYIGDAMSDVPGMREVGVAACPSNAAPEARAAASLVLESPGGMGAVAELTRWILAREPRAREQAANGEGA